MIGKILAHYQILEKIGAGGMGEVYRARDTKLDRDVAIKILPPDSARDPQHRRRFEREAKAVAALKHPNIVTIHSVEEVDGVHFITMELVEGQTLTEILPAGGLPLERFFAIAIPIADAVSCAHAHGVTHRDLKPANIMVDREQRPKILDFGLAKLWFSPTPDVEETVLAATQITEAGHILGTAAYMSPEQVTGGEVGGWSDIFSLGIIFYELLSGARPFCGEYPAEIMHNIVNAQAPRLPSLPNTLGDVIDRCLRKTPRERFTSADELRDALQLLTETSATTAMVEPVVSSPEARAAFDRGDWESAYREFHTIGGQRDLASHELEMLGTCASWLNEFDECTQTWERAYAGYAKTGRNIAAARLALELVGIYVVKNADTVAGGWQKRAERLLQNEPDCLERGLLLRRQTVVALGKCDFTRAWELNRQCAEIADRFGDLDLQTVALHDRGQILIARGDVAEGMGLVDEAMASAVSGEVNPATLGNLYCRTMVVCRSLADFKRVREWSEAAWRWCETYTASGYRGVCRIHSAETMRHLGLWTDAERAVRNACTDFEKSGLNGHAGEAFNEFGELSLRKGDYRAAENAFQRAHEFGYDPVPGLPLLRLAQGRGEAARQTIQRALSESPEDRLRRAKLLTATVTIALANSDLSFAEAAANELSDISKEFDCQCFRAHALLGQGAVKLEQGNNEGATPALREAWSIFNELGFSYDAARARTILATAYLGVGNDEDARLQLTAACKTFSELGADPDLMIASELIDKSK